MKPIVNICFSVVTASMLTWATALAGDASQYELIGFSADGRYVAFERYGVEDGSAFPYSEMFILDVVLNEYVVKPIFKVIEDDTGSARTECKKAASGWMAKYGIIEGNRGTLAWQSNREASVRQAVIEEGDQPLWIVLTEHEVQSECTGGNGRIFDLEVQYDDGASKSLQRDELLPASRGCAYSYRLEAVYTYLSYLAVIVEYESDGYEGPNTRQLIVTGKKFL